MKEEIDYNFVVRNTSGFYSIKLSTGKYSGVIYTYGGVSISENSSNDSATLSFDYKIEDTSESSFSASELNETDDFKNYIGDILVKILSDSEGQIGHDGSKSTDRNH